MALENTEPGGPPGHPSPDGPPAKAAGGRSASIRLIGGLIALATGLVVIGLVAGGAIIAGTDNAAKIATAAFGVIGSTVGAYFGVKIGTDGTQKAIDAQREEATKAQVYAAHLPPGDARKIVEMAQAAAKGEVPRPDA